MKKIAEERGVSVSDVALNYLLQKPAVTSLIIGVRKIEQLQAERDYEELNYYIVDAMLK